MSIIPCELALTEPRSNIIPSLSIPEPRRINPQKDQFSTPLQLFLFTVTYTRLPISLPGFNFLQQMASEIWSGNIIKVMITTFRLKVK